MSLSALGAAAGTGLLASAFGSIMSSGVNARNADVSSKTSAATAPMSNSISANLGIGQSNMVSSGSSYSQGWSEGYTAGKEASEADILRAREANEAALQRAREANEAQKQMMQMQMDYNTAEAKLAREWSENMSNTAYQRAVKDLKAAGLNPVLAVNNMGASTPGASYASSGLGSAAKADTYKATTYPESWTKSKSSGGSSQSSKSSSNEFNIGGSKSDSGPAYIKATGGVAEALANSINVGSASSLKNDNYPTEEELIKAAWGEG